MVARAASIGGRIPGLWSQYAVEHVCGFGFVKRGFDLGRFDREKHRLLGLENLDTTTVSHGDCKMLWSLDLADKHVTSDGDVHVRIFFAC